MNEEYQNAHFTDENGVRWVKLELANSFVNESSSSPGCYLPWISVDDEWPAIGEKVILFSNGVVQQETFEFDQSDNGFGGSEHFWGRDDVDECPKVESGQFWMRLPSGPGR